MNSDESADGVKYLRVICLIGAIAWSIICWKAMQEGALSYSSLAEYPDPRLEDWVKITLRVLVIGGIILGGLVEGLKMLGGSWTWGYAAGGFGLALLAFIISLGLVVCFPVIPIGISTFKSFANTDE